MIEEIAVFVTSDGLGRAGIVQRQDGMFEVYEHWIWNDGTRQAFNVAPGGRTSWFNDDTELELLYEDVEPQPSLFGSLEDAISGLLGQSAFLSAIRLK